MARPLRLHIPSMLYHVMSRGNDKQRIFSTDEDCTRYLAVLAETTSRFDVRCLAYCLMVNHVHLLVQPHDVPLSRLMQQLNSTYAQWFNREHDRVGHLLQGRYKAILVDSDPYLLRLLRYILWNPVRARRVDHPRDWPWSSYRATAGHEPPPAFLRVEEIWGALGAESTYAAHEQFVFFASEPEESLPDMPLLLGSPRFRERIEPLLRARQRDRDFTCRERFAARPPLDAILSPHARGPALDTALWVAFKRYAYTLRELGAHLQRPPGTIWAWIRRASPPPAD